MSTMATEVMQVVMHTMVTMVVVHNRGAGITGDESGMEGLLWVDSYCIS